MTPRFRLLAIACAGVLIAALAGLAYIHINSRTEPTDNLSSTVPGSSPALAVNPALQPHVPRPTEQPRPYTNEELHVYLQGEQKRLGIRKIYTNTESRAQRPSKNPEKAEAQEAARRKMQDMTGFIRSAMEAHKKPPVALQGDKVGLLSAPDAATARGSPVTGEQALATIRPGGAVVRSQDELNRLWDDLKSSRPKPTVDFTRSMMVVVIADPDSGHGVAIPQVSRTSENLVVRYRDSLPNEPGIYYEFQIVDRTALPVIFQKTGAPSK